MATARRRDTGLTPAQEAYAVFLSLGHSQIDAYRLAYPNQAKGSKKTTLEQNASTLAADTQLVLRVRQLTDTIHKAGLDRDIADLVERKVHATTVLRHDGASRRDQLAANRLLGEYEKELGAGSQPVTNVYGDVYVNQVTQQLTLLMAEADARWPGLLDWYRERVKALGEGQGAVQ